MFIDANEIGAAELRIDTPVRPPSASGAGDPQWLRGRLMGVAQRRSGAVELSARLEAALRTECSRCLEAVDIAIGADFLLRIVPRAVEHPAQERELAADEALLYESADGKVDLDVVAHEQAYLALPLKPICRPECRGLCPACGANRNNLECGCGAGRIDPRWAPLASLRFPKNPGES